MVNVKIPVNIITGFLGSGKTTAIIRLLNNKPAGDKWAVIINEFGKVSIDSQTLRSSSDSGNIYEVSGGCICCSAKGYFRENLEQIIQTGSFSRIIIEPSGLGGIDMVSEIVQAMSNLLLLRIICTVDILGLEIEKLQRLPIYRNQIMKADVIVFTKCDLLAEKATENHLVEKFKSLYPGKPCYLNSQDNSFWPSLLDPNASEKQVDTFRMISSMDIHLTDINYQSYNYFYNSDIIFSTQKVVIFLQNNPEIFRAKGYLNTEDGWMLLNFTHTGSHFEPCSLKAQSQLILIAERSHFKSGENFESELNSAFFVPPQSGE